MSISAGLLVIAIVLIRAVAINRLPKNTFLILWGVAIFRLLVPVYIPVRFNFFSAMSTAGNVPPLNEMAATIALMPIGETTASQGLGIKWATVIWFAGMMAFLIFFIVTYLKNHYRFRFATLIGKDDFLNMWLKENRLTRSIAIMQSDRVLTPITIGLIKPKIILPICMNMSDKQLLTHVLTHEYYHIKRFDALWKIILVLAVCIHWFNPLVWVMFVLANHDLELTCDEMVIHRMGMKTKTSYAYALISMAEKRSKFASLLYNGFSKNAAVERIESIMKMKRKSIASLIAAIVLVAALAIGTLTTLAADYDYPLEEEGYNAVEDFNVEFVTELYDELADAIPYESFAEFAYIHDIDVEDLMEDAGLSYITSQVGLIFDGEEWVIIELGEDITPVIIVYIKEFITID